MVSQIDNLPKLISKTLESNTKMCGIANRYYKREHTLFLGRGLDFPVALEGALKLKEISYIHAEGYPAAEMKHGPIALIDAQMPVFVVASNSSTIQKTISNVQEIKSRKGEIIMVVQEGMELPNGLADNVIEIPKSHDLLSPILASIPLQLFSFHAAKLRGCNIDQPRNLAKSVTVE